MPPAMTGKALHAAAPLIAQVALPAKVSQNNPFAQKEPLFRCIDRSTMGTGVSSSPRLVTSDS
jgi:hypothetical protein